MAIDRRAFLKGSSLSVLASSSLLQARQNRIQNDIENLIKLKKSQQQKPIVVLYPKGCLGNLEPIRTRFESLSGIRVTLKEASLDEISSELILTGKLINKYGNFDVAIPPTFAIPDLVEANIIADLTDYARKWEPAGFRDSHLYSIGDFHLNKLYGYQTDGDAYLLFLRKSWLESKENSKKFKQRFGQDLTIPVTWEQLDQQIKFFHQPEKQRYGGTLFRNQNYLLWEFWIRMHGKGQLPFNDDMEPLIDSPASLMALQELITTSAYLDPNADKYNLFENFQTFAEGQSYCNLGWGGTQKYLNGPKSKVKDDLIFLPAPGGTFGEKSIYIPYFNWGWNYVVSAKSESKDIAYLFCLFANSPVVSTEAVREASGYFDPYRTEHYSDEKIIATYGKDFLVTHSLSMKDSIPDLYLQAQGLYLAALKQAIYSANQGQIRPDIALKLVAKKWQSITKKIGRKKQSRLWNNLLKSYPKNLIQFLKPEKKH